MVKPFKCFFRIAGIATACLCASAFTEPTPSGVSLATECIKKEIYVGEQVLCNFMVAAPEDMLEVEVAKFPEFRGFWSENIALRQGPTPLLPGFEPNVRKAVVGSYILTPMIGRADPQIIAMKLIVRHPLSDRANEETLTSEPAPLVVKPLPPVPAEEAGLFKGAVGTFAVVAETREVAFQKDEPVTVRISLQGEGNFQEINDLPLSLPSEAEILSKRAFTQGAGQFYSKTFDVTLAVHSDRSFDLTPPPFVFFNPTLRRFERLEVPSISFRFVPSTPRAKESDREPLELKPVFTAWTPYTPISKRWSFWLMQLILSGGIVVLVTSRFRRKAKEREKNNRQFQRHVKWEIARNALQMGNLEVFLRLADELVFEWLKETHGLPEGMTRYQALAHLDGKLPEESLSIASLLFHTRDQFSYSAEKTAPSDPQSLESGLSQLLRRAG